MAAFSFSVSEEFSTTDSFEFSICGVLMLLLFVDDGLIVALLGPTMLVPPLPGPPVSCDLGISTCSETGGSENFTLRLLMALPFPLSLISPYSDGIGDSVRFKIDAVGEAPLGEGTNFCHGLDLLASKCKLVGVDSNSYN